MTTPHDGIHSGHEAHGIQGDAAHGHHAEPPLPFSDADVADFRKEDIHAARAVVLLMTGIFGIGIVLYILVALTTWPTAVNG